MFFLFLQDTSLEVFFKCLMHILVADHKPRWHIARKATKKLRIKGDSFKWADDFKKKQSSTVIAQHKKQQWS